MRSLGAAIVLVAWTSAWAQLSAAGAAASVTPPAGTAPVRWPDVAYDPVDDVFLGVSGAGNVLGAYFSASGAAIGPSFVVNSGAVFGQAPRVAYDPDTGGFLVTWHESIGNDTRIRGRIIRYAQAALTNDFDLSPFGTNWEMGATIAYAKGSQEFLVGWQDRATTQIHVQRVSGAGALLGAVITLEATPYARDPSIGYDPDTNRFLVGYAGCVGNNDCFVHAQLIQAGTGALVGSPLILDASIKAGYIPEIAYNSATQQFFVVWYRVTATAGLFGRAVSATGTLGPVVTVSSVYASYDANSVAYNPISNTFIVVTHGSTAQDVALELSASGQPLNPSGVAFGPAGASGNFNPRCAASTLAADWLAVTSTAFNTFTAQRLTTLTRDSTGVTDAGTPLPDAGMPDAGMPDSGTPDSGTPDSGTPDSGGQAPDAGLPDAAIADAGTATPDAAVADAGAQGSDAGPASDGGKDAGASDAGAPDARTAVGSCGCSNPNPALSLLCSLLACAGWARRGRSAVTRIPGTAKGSGTR